MYVYSVVTVKKNVELFMYVKTVIFDGHYAI